MGFIKKLSIPLVVFLTGICVLVIEVTATRILSPYYGSTIFTVSSVIGIVLAALSLGYYIGGKLADKYPKEILFYAIILISGLSVLFLHFLSELLLPLFGYKLSLTNGPLIFAIVLFFLPGFLLGTLSPFAIKLQGLRFPNEGAGSIAGSIFFWSTLGSIIGSIATGFFLIPYIGIRQIIIGVGLFLILLGVLPLVKAGLSRKRLVMIISFIVIELFFIVLISVINKSPVVYSRDGIYEKIIIYDTEYNGQPTRIFQQDRSNSGAMYLNSDELVFDYTKYYSLYKIFKPDTKEALVIGGGAYSIPKALLAESGDINVDVSEIEPSLLSLGKKYFKVAESDRLHNYTEDGRRFLYDTKKNYDLIYSDVYYSFYSIPAHFTTQEFFKIAKDKLSEDGIFIANMIGELSRRRPSLIMSEIKTFLSVFPNSYFFAVDSAGKNTDQNIIFVGYNSDKAIDFINIDLEQYENTGIDNLKEKIIDINRFELSPYKILTDNYSPVEHLTAGVLKRNFDEPKLLDGGEILGIIDQQLRYGPRYINVPGHDKVEKFLVTELETLSPEVSRQTWTHQDSGGGEYELSNIVARFFPQKSKRIILGTHYDSKKFADLDRLDPSQAVPGANDSASGVAVILELARAIRYVQERPEIGIDIVFFDGEEGEENQGRDYSNWKPLGSSYFAEHLDEFYPDEKPIGAVIVDMVCEEDLKIFKEATSVNNAGEEVARFWDIAQVLSPEVFQDSIGAAIHDDHTPLNQAGIPSFLIIDLEYPYFHTTEDTLDKCSADSLEAVAEVIMHYIFAPTKYPSTSSSRLYSRQAG